VLECFQQSLKLSREIRDRGNEARALYGLGDLNVRGGRWDDAQAYSEQALALFRQVGDRQGEALTLANLAYSANGGGNPGKARELIEEMLAITESLRTNVFSPELRASFLASYRYPYEFYIDLLVSLGQPAAALQASERSRARSLLELLTEARADIRQSNDPELLQRERELLQLIAAKEQDQAALYAGQAKLEHINAVIGQIEELLTQLQSVQAEIRARSPHYAGLMQPIPLSLEEIQRQVLDADTLLLEYALGHERSFLWAITTDSNHCYELPPRARIEEAALRLYNLWSYPYAVEGTEIYPFPDDSILTAGRDLSEMLLKPAAELLQVKRLLIVGDGALHYIPFSALPEPSSLDDLPADKNYVLHQLLVARHEIISLPSASTLAVMRLEKTESSQARKSCAIFADPVFQKNDERLAAVASELSGNSWKDEDRKTLPGNERQVDTALARSAEAAGLFDGERFERLEDSSNEASAILGLANENECFMALGFDASREKVTTVDLRPYRIVHFATHGMFHGEQPELSGLVLSLVDKQGAPQNGFLRLHDIYNLNLNADLVVLSACQTALGKNIKGEGLVGITRGFMYAGAKCVLASLWQVEDAATAGLMKLFYENILKHGVSPATALREAQIALAQYTQWQHPYYWAGFILQGDWS
jgi:CHAT domain-containing protein